YALSWPAQQAILQEHFARMQQQNPKLTPHDLENFRVVGLVGGVVGVVCVLLASLALSAGLFYLVFQMSGLGLGYQPILRGIAYSALIQSGLSSLVQGLVIFANDRA